MIKLKNSKSRVTLLLLIFTISIFIAVGPELTKADPQPEEDPYLIFGTMMGPDSIDPHDAWDTYSSNVMDQVVETLLSYDFSAPDLAVIPRLATNLGIWSVDNLNYTVTLRTGVIFHDGTSFNASVVQWNFNRLAHFMNVTGMLPPGEWPTIIDQMYRWEDGTPIINRTEVINLNTIKFVLNRPYGVFDALLCFSGSGIVSPASTPGTEYIDLETGDLIGTGPFEYDYYILHDEVKFHAFENYWAGAAEIKDLTFKVISDIDDRNQALLSGAVDLLNDPYTSYIDTMTADPNLNVIDAGGNVITQYLGMNNKQLNRTFRRAISYAINYDFIIDGILNGHGIRLRSHLPEGIRYANWSFDVATTDVVQAREIMQSMGFGVGWDSTFPGSDEAQWISANFRTLNYTYNAGNMYREGLLDVLENSLPLIGIKVENGAMTWEDYKDRLFNRRVSSAGYDALQLFNYGWIPDLNDPSNYINPFFSNTSIFNSVQVNDPYLQELIEQGIGEVDLNIREAMYDEIQRYLVEELMPLAFLSVNRNFDAYRRDIYGYQSNPMDKVWFHGVSRQDLFPPETTIYLEGLLSFDGYYMSNVTVYLDAVDDMSGIHYTQYSFNEVDWINYTDPFVIIDEGITALYYRSVDNKGNVEETKLEVIQIYERPFDHPAVIFGTLDVPNDLDPHYTWDTFAFNVLDQVVEGLFAYDLSAPDLAVIPRLAADFGTWSPDGLNYTVSLRSGITFHDGSPFDAYDVQWNFDRLAYFMNVSGTLPSDKWITMIDSLYRWDDGTPFIHHTEVVNSDTIKFVLNQPYGAFETLLCLRGSGILSPTSTPDTEYINIEYDTLIGTGPFVFDEYNPNIGVRFHAFQDYWQGPANFNDLWFLIIRNAQERNNAIVDGSIDLLADPLPDMIDAFETNPDLAVASIPSATIYYLSMNNSLINQTMRQAISYAINYTHIIEVFMNYNAVRLGSPIPEGIKYANSSFKVATMNITHARKILVDNGICSFNIYNDAEWLAAAATNPIATYKYPYNVENILRGNIGSLLVENLELIGIEVLLEPLSWEEFLWRVYIEPSGLDLLFTGWIPDFNDPSTYLNWLMSDTSPYELAEINDPYLQGLIDQGRAETDQIVREAIYDDIQQYVVEQLMPWAYLFVTINFDAYNNKITGYQTNPMDIVWFYSTTVPDVIPPETSIDISGIRGFDGWYLSNATVSLWAEDDDSGVAFTEYSFNNVDWITYSDSFVVSDEGITTIYYRSEDNLGNVEETKIEIIEIHKRPTDDPTVIFGTYDVPNDLDPHYTWDTPAYNVLDQVVEGLFAFDLSAPDLAIIPRLADNLGTWSLDGLTYTVSLRSGILFHDGTPFDADAVQWNFDRLAYFMNVSGTLPSDKWITMINSLYRWDDGTPIIHHTEVVNPNMIRFVLNRPYGAFEALLCFTGSGILSPASTSFTEYINIEYDALVGTGPFVFHEYNSDIGARFQMFADYWQGPASFDDLWFLIIEGAQERNDALLDEIIDLLADPLPDMIDTFETNPDLTVASIPSAIIYYLSMNNSLINQTMRQSISYAINYTYIIEVLKDNNAVRLESPIPEGIRYANWIYDVAKMNITHARKILVDNGVCNFDIYNDVEWLTAAATNPIATYKYPFNIGNMLRENIGNLLVENLEQIGIRVLLEPLDWSEFVWRVYIDPSGLDLIVFGWIPDLNDPSSYLNWLMSNTSPYEFAEINDPYLQNLIDQGLAETNPAVREAIYDEVQQYLVEELMPWAYLFANINYDAYNNKLTGYQTNPMDEVWFYSVIGPDTIPPETEVWMDGILGFDGWYLSDVIVSLWGEDDDSGVAFSEYSFNNEDWITYSDPFVVTDEGVMTIYYRSVDNEGNIEETKIDTIEIQRRPLNDPKVIFGTWGLRNELDPHNVWDSQSYDVLDQVVETLFAYNLSHPQMEIIPRLASDYGSWSPDGLTYTVSLRTGVMFHDATPFNANAVQWNFDRLAYFMNISGTLPPDKQRTIIESLYSWPDGTPIIHHTEVINSYTIKFVLNSPYAPLEALLCFSGSGMLSPASTPDTEYIDIEAGDLVGTGPFIFDEFISEIGVRFHAYQNYWKGAPEIKDLWFLIIENTELRNQALQDGTIDFMKDPLTSWLDSFIADPNIELDYGPELLINYLGMNNKQINQTMRQAISCAINYSNIISELLGDQAVRLNSPVPIGMMYANWSFNVAKMNITYARKILVDGGVCNFDIYNDAEWLAAVATDPIAIYNYTYNFGNIIREKIGLLLVDNLEKIGIRVELAGMEWSEYIIRLFEFDSYTRDHLQLFILNWIPDLNDPSDILNHLFSNTSPFNMFQVDDLNLESLLDQGLAETVPTARKAIYDEIQQYLVEELMPMSYLYQRFHYIAYNSKFTGYQWNPMGEVWFHTVWQPSVTIDTPTGDNVEVNDPIHDVVLNFDEITDSGETTITLSDTGPDPQSGFEVAGNYYDIATTASYSGIITIAITYDETQVIGDEADLRLMHWNETAMQWEDVTTWVDTLNNIIYGEFSSLSLFAIVEPVDFTAPSTSISLSGVLGNENWYISDILITLTATDDLSGVAIIEYSLDGTNWVEYLSQFTFDIEGSTTFYYRSIDIVGNVELTNSEIILVDKTPPDTEIIITDCYTDDENNIYVSYDSTFILLAMDNYSGVENSFYSINSGEWIEFIGSFNLTGLPEEYIIEYYSIDIAGNIEMISFTTVILEEEILEEYQGYGILRLNGEIFIGSATLSISNETIQLEIGDQIVTWEIVDYTENCNFEIYIGEGELGWIKVTVITHGDSTYVIAYGSGILFFGSS